VKQLFKKVDYSINKLLEDIAAGDIGLPDIQRPFVWTDTKVRDLFDSMYRGYPIGYFLFWENGVPTGHKPIGESTGQKSPHLLIVDGQQRLTSLYSVIKGQEIVDKEYRKRRIQIAFNPLEERFEVSNPALAKSAEWTGDISELWGSAVGFFKVIERFQAQLRQSKPEIDDASLSAVPERLQRLHDLLHYPVTALEVSADVDEEQVADIFVRVNSKGQALNQASFILTLMSVFWDEGRAELEQFCKNAQKPSPDGRPSPYNAFIKPQPDQLLRVSVALGFRRARLEHVYLLLRGKDLQTKEFSNAQREQQFAILRDAQKKVLDLVHWHEFLKAVAEAGYPSGRLVSSDVGLLYTYALWLIGRCDFELDLGRLRRLIARWFFMQAMTGRYTGSPESRMDEDLALLRRPGMTAADFERAIQSQIDTVLTRDYWEVTLPSELSTGAARSPVKFAFYAAQYILEAPVLFSTMKVQHWLAPVGISPKPALEAHHLFPRGYLKKLGYEDRDINQAANMALVEWPDNLDIADTPPSEYARRYESRFDPATLAEMYRLHALPERWYEMPYEAFLAERRKRMAALIREAYARL